jgi:enoyl-CoA hydratase/carnithine racemase
MISVEQRDRVLVLKLNRDITNALNFEHVTEVAEAIERVRQDPDVRGMVLTSSNEKIFSLGFDIPWLYKDPEQVDRFYRFFNRTCLDLYTLPKPAIAAITGHAVAGGCILALCCDYRYIARGRKLMGLNEIKLGLPVPYLPDCLLRQLVGVRTARDMMETGEFYPAEELLKMGMVDELLPQEEVISRAVAKAAKLGKADQAYALIKRNRVESIEARIRQYGEENDQAFLKVWFSEEAQERIKEAIKKF